MAAALGVLSDDLGVDRQFLVHARQARGQVHQGIEPAYRLAEGDQQVCGGVAALHVLALVRADQGPLLGGEALGVVGRHHHARPEAGGGGAGDAVASLAVEAALEEGEAETHGHEAHRPDQWQDAVVEDRDARGGEGQTDAAWRPQTSPELGQRREQADQGRGGGQDPQAVGQLRADQAAGGQPQEHDQQDRAAGRGLRLQKYQDERVNRHRPSPPAAS